MAEGSEGAGSQTDQPGGRPLRAELECDGMELDQKRCKVVGLVLSVKKASPSNGKMKRSSEVVVKATRLRGACVKWKERVSVQVR